MGFLVVLCGRNREKDTHSIFLEAEVCAYLENNGMEVIVLELKLMLLTSQTHSFVTTHL